MAVSITALALVLWLVVTEPWESDVQSETPVVQSGNEEHTRELDGEMLRRLISYHVMQLIASEGLKDKTISKDGIEILEELPGYRCFWTLQYNDSSQAHYGYPNVYDLDSSTLNYKYVEKDDIWLVTSVRLGCENNLETWTIDDNTGTFTYGRLP